MAPPLVKGGRKGLKAGTGRSDSAAAARVAGVSGSMLAGAGLAGAGGCGFASWVFISWIFIS
jgi:hypothetical protein